MLALIALLVKIIRNNSNYRNISRLAGVCLPSLASQEVCQSPTPPRRNPPSPTSLSPRRSLPPQPRLTGSLPPRRNLPLPASPCLASQEVCLTSPHRLAGSLPHLHITSQEVYLLHIASQEVCLSLPRLAGSLPHLSTPPRRKSTSPTSPHRKSASHIVSPHRSLPLSKDGTQI